jgi:undecaprenyl-diphosphatase
MLPRARPYLVVAGARTLDVEGGGSFPSGHSKNGFTAAAILGSKWRKLKWPLYILAFLIGLSRVYVGLHWPFDVIVGSIVGWVIGKVTIRYETKIINLLHPLTAKLHARI